MNKDLVKHEDTVTVECEEDESCDRSMKIPNLNMKNDLVKHDKTMTVECEEDSSDADEIDNVYIEIVNKKTSKSNCAEVPSIGQNSRQSKLLKFDTYSLYDEGSMQNYHPEKLTQRKSISKKHTIN